MVSTQSVSTQARDNAAGAFAGALFASGYLFVVLKVVEVASGLLLLAGRFVTLALALLAPIVVNIVLFHAFLAPSGLPLALLVLALEIFLAWSYRSAYRPMLAARVAPTERDRPLELRSSAEQTIPST